ncbi:MAG TPA: hypothetical protein IAB12_03010 [Candidatus Ornithospirochaeta avicola]|uniref:Lipoprotein n=1 Tax=Candidatus Ornithospirochaeta avicola TaxID=2840896 RepID=A0A9D1PSH4_9SPIO|nr:hypothetical protein [Candidatus Ornithospirochaeta avicola]
MRKVLVLLFSLFLISCSPYENLFVRIKASEEAKNLFVSIDREIASIKNGDKKVNVDDAIDNLIGKDDISMEEKKKIYEAILSSSFMKEHYIEGKGLVITFSFPSFFNGLDEMISQEILSLESREDIEYINARLSLKLDSSAERYKGAIDATEDLIDFLDAENYSLSSFISIRSNDITLSDVVIVQKTVLSLYEILIESVFLDFSSSSLNVEEYVKSIGENPEKWIVSTLFSRQSRALEAVTELYSIANTLNTSSSILNLDSLGELLK